MLNMIQLESQNSLITG